MAPSVLILVENMSVPRDQRVWQEALTLRRAGYDVSVICPMGADVDDGDYEVRDGIEIHRYRPAVSTGGAAGYMREYASAMWRMGRLVRRLARERHFDVVHACNPPDLLLLLGLPLKLRGTRLVFDHHDLVPELYRVRFARGRDPIYLATLLLERLTMTIADVVIATNESFRDLAITRGGKRSDDVFVVRNAPDLERFRNVRPRPELKRGRAHLLVYVGVMAPQDGVDYAVRALAAMSRPRDWHAVFAGEGDSLGDLKRLAQQLGLETAIEFPGWLDSNDVLELIATADVCLAPDPVNELNDRSTMIKVAEYMALGKAVVSFALAESRFTAGEAAAFAAGNDVGEFARCIEALLDDPARRGSMGRFGRERVWSQLSWKHSERELLAAYARAREQTL